MKKHLYMFIGYMGGVQKAVRFFDDEWEAIRYCDDWNNCLGFPAEIYIYQKPLYDNDFVSGYILYYGTDYRKERTDG